jgi:hypothetical protein
MNGHENLGSTIENNISFNNPTNENIPRNSSSDDIESQRKSSRLMIISLTFHSLGIIFGDM